MSREAERLASLLDDWLAGEAVQPEAPEQGALLAAAARVRALEAVPPAPGGLRRGRSSFITAGVAQAEARRRPGRLAGLGLGRLGPRQRLAPVALGLILAFTVGAATTVQAQASLPGDALYPVKRLTESVQVSIARGEERESLRAALQARRRHEAQALLAQHRAEQVQFEGQVVSLLDGRLTVDGLVIALGDLGEVEGLALGAVVRVAGVTGPDGVLIARSVEVLRPVEPPSAGVDGVAATPVPRLVAGGNRPEPTPTRRPTDSASAPAPTQLATTLAPLVPTLTPMPTELPTTVPVGPRLRDRQVVEWTGYLERVGPEWWVVAGQEVYRPSGRVVGEARVGALVWVKAERKKGALQLIELRVLNPAPSPEVVEWRGTIESIEGSTWTVDGQEVVVTDDTEVVGTPEVGRIAHVRAELYPGGRRVALRIEIEGPVVVEFSGPLESFDDEVWLVGRRTVWLVPGVTEVRGTPWLGARVDVRARESDGGLLEALLLVVQDGPPTGTPEPGATPGTGGPGATTTALPSPRPTGVPPAGP